MKGRQIVKEAATLISGSMLAQAVSLAAYLILTRIYSPDDYGLFNIFYSYIEVLIILSTCKYELAAVVAGTEHEAAAISRFALRLNTTVSLVLLMVALVLWSCGWLPAHFQPLGWMVLLIPPMVFFCGTSRIYSFLYNRFHRYNQIALSDNVNAFSAAGFKIGLGAAGMHSSGLVVGTVIGQAIANLNYRLRLHSLHLPATSRADRLDAARRHRNFPMFVATKDFVNTFSSNLPFLWAAAYFDRAEIGLFGLALTFTMQPARLVATAFERVLYARTTEAVRNQQTIWPLIKRFLLLINAAAIPVCLAAYIWAEPVFGFLFGGRWQDCGPYVQLLLPWIWLSFNGMSLLFIANVFGTQRIEIRFYIVMLMLRVAAIYTGIRMGSFVLAMRMFAYASAIVQAALIAWYLLQVRRYEHTIKD